MNRRMWLAIVGLGLAEPFVDGLSAAETGTTSIRVSDMHCGACAKKIAGKLFTVPGVARVQTDVSNHTAVVFGSAGRTPSARRLWEAVEAAGFKPVRLSGPEGTFDAKPPQ